MSAVDSAKGLVFTGGAIPTGSVTPGDLEAETLARELADDELKALADAGDQVRLSYVSGDGQDATFEVVAAQAALTLGVGQLVQFAWQGANTASDPTLTIGSTAYTLRASDGSDLAAGDLRAASYVARIHSGSVIRVLSLTRIADVPSLASTLSAHAASDAALLNLASAGDQVRLSYVSGDGQDATFEVVAAQAALTLGVGQLVQFAWQGANTASDPTLTIGLTAYTLRAADGSAIAAGAMSGRSYLARIHAATVIRVLNLTRISDVPGLQPALDANAAAASAAQDTADDAVQDAAEALNEAMDASAAAAAEVVRATGVEAEHESRLDEADLERRILRAVQQVLANAGVFPLGKNNLGIVHGVKNRLGRLLWGQRASGTTYEGNVLREVTGDNNLGLVWGIVARSITNKLRVLIGVTADGTLVGASVEARSRVELLTTTGQSLAEGAGAAITTTAPYTGGEALKFANGPVGKQSEVTGPGIVALAEQTNETITTGMARRILATHPDRTLLGMGQAWGGETIEEISLGGGSGVYEKIQDQMDLASAQSRGAVARIVNMINGEANGLLSSTDFHLKLEAYRQQFAIDCAERLGQTEVPYLFTCQTSSVAGYKGGSIALRDSFTTPFLQLLAALTNPLIVLVGPKYQYTYLDHSHIVSLSTRLHGEKYGQVYRHVITDQRQWLPVHASNVLRDNDAIVLTLHSPVGMPIEVDTVSVTDPGDLGFNLLDAGGVTIGSVTQTGDFEVTVECSGNVPDGSRLSYAFHNGTAGTSGWNTGARGCIRDSDPTRSIFTNAAMPNWLCAFQANF